MKNEIEISRNDRMQTIENMNEQLMDSLTGSQQPHAMDTYCEVVDRKDHESNVYIRKHHKDVSNFTLRNISTVADKELMGRIHLHLAAGDQQSAIKEYQEAKNVGYEEAANFISNLEFNPTHRVNKRKQNKLNLNAFKWAGVVMNTTIAIVFLTIAVFAYLIISM